MCLLTCQVSWTVLVSKWQDQNSTAKTKIKTETGTVETETKSKTVVKMLYQDKTVSRDVPSLTQVHKKLLKFQQMLIHYDWQLTWGKEPLR